jgi:ATP-dependent Clp protease ATP-binding subunit ClpC
MGARPLRRAIQRYIEDPLADFVLRAELPAGGTVVVDKNPTPEDGEPEVSLTVLQPKVPAAVGGGEQPAELEAGEAPADAPEAPEEG